ncbi:MAG: glycerol kinase [Cyclobacteriaceae bacterium]|jgi:glycerol kinase
MKYILTLDQGTTSSRTLVVNQNGEIVSSSQKEFTQYFPKPGWVEHDADEIYQTQLETVADAINKSNVAIEDIVGIGITNQRETVVIWDKNTGVPIHPAIVWQDRRTTEYCEGLKEKGFFDQIREKTGLPIDAYFSGSKVNWLLNHVEEARAKAQKGELLFGTIDTWLIWKMTNGKSHVTDMTNASRTMLFNIKTLNWDTDLLSLFEVPEIMLPEVKSSANAFGFYELDGHQIPIGGVAGDQQAALFGQGCLQKGQAKNTYGTGCFMLMNQGPEFVLSENGLITTLACSLADEPVYAFEGSVFVAGAAVQWLRDGLEIIDTAEQTQDMAATTEDDELVIVPAFVGLGTPYWDMYARGAIFGITRDSGRAQFAKAALQAIAFQTKDVIEAMSKDGGVALEKLKVDGGATANEYLMQFQSDILDVEILRPDNAETTAMGAAYLAGLHVGLWNTKQISELSSKGTSYHSKMSEGQRSKLYSNWKKAVSRTLGWLKD